MHCPRCSEPFETFYEGLYEDILCHRCDECGALWMPPESLDRLDDNVSVDASRIEWAQRDLDDGLTCPSCAGTYRTQGAQLQPVEIPTDPTINAHRCAGCRGFLMTPETLDQVRELVMARVAPRG